VLRFAPYVQCLSFHHRLLNILVLQAKACFHAELIRNSDRICTCWFSSHPAAFYWHCGRSGNSTSRQIKYDEGSQWRNGMQNDEQIKRYKALETDVENMQLLLGKQRQESNEAAAQSEHVHSKAVSDVRFHYSSSLRSTCDRLSLAQHACAQHIPCHLHEAQDFFGLAWIWAAQL
jgi:hypothetical protein